jgi:hypothetical protein
MVVWAIGFNLATGKLVCTSNVAAAKSQSAHARSPTLAIFGTYGASQPYGLEPIGDSNANLSCSDTT